MKVVPVGDNVILKRIEPEQTTPGGIILPDTAREHSQQGRVLSVGDGRLLPNGKRVAHQVKDGDRVVFRSYAGTEVVLDGEELLILREDDILAVVD